MVRRAGECGDGADEGVCERGRLSGRAADRVLGENDAARLPDWLCDVRGTVTHSVSTVSVVFHFLVCTRSWTSRTSSVTTAFRLNT